MQGLTFDPGPHVYVLDGRPTVSVTGVLKAMGLVKLGGIPAPILERARTRGQDVHELLHYYNEQDLEPASVDDRYRGYLEAWIRFCEERSFKVLLCERRIASRKHRVCGTLDALGLLDGYGALIDFKTGSPDDVAADLQTAAYEGLARTWALEGDDTQLAAVLALEEFKRIRRLAVQLKKDATFHIEPYDDPTDYTKFLTLTAAYHIAADRGAELALEDVA